MNLGDWRVAAKAVDVMHRIVLLTSANDADIVAESNIARIKETIAFIDSRVLFNAGPLAQMQWSFVRKRLSFIKAEWKLLQIRGHRYMEESLKIGVLPCLRECRRYIAAAADCLNAAQSLKTR